jgi:hypothetical protein
MLMPAFAQDLTAEYKHVWLIRLGELVQEWSDDWEYCVNCCSNDAETCVLYGLRSDSKFNWRHKLMIEAAIYRLGFKFVKWGRYKKKKGVDRAFVIRPPADVVPDKIPEHFMESPGHSGCPDCGMFHPPDGMCV